MSKEQVVLTEVALAGDVVFFTGMALLTIADVDAIPRIPNELGVVISLFALCNSLYQSITFYLQAKEADQKVQDDKQYQYQHNLRSILLGILLFFIALATFASLFLGILAGFLILANQGLKKCNIHLPVVTFICLGAVFAFASCVSLVKYLRTYIPSLYRKAMTKIEITTQTDLDRAEIIKNNFKIEHTAKDVAFLGQFLMTVAVYTLILPPIVGTCVGVILGALHVYLNRNVFRNLSAKFYQPDPASHAVDPKKPLTTKEKQFIKLTSLNVVNSIHGFVSGLVKFLALARYFLVAIPTPFTIMVGVICYFGGMLAGMINNHQSLANTLKGTGSSPATIFAKCKSCLFSKPRNESVSVTTLAASVPPSPSF